MNTVHIAILSKVYSLQLRKLIFTFQFCLVLITSTSSFTPLPEEIHSGGLTIIDLIYQEKFKQAEDKARQIIKKYPAHPAGYFFMAVTIDSWSQVYQSDKRVDEFYRYCNLSIEKGEAILSKDNKDQWAKFFIGGADGYKGTFEARYEKWITAFRYGWKGVSIFLELEKEKSSIVDINYGIGNYDYWRSALMKVLWFMSRVDDKRQRAIDRLYLSKREGVFTKTTSSSALIDILLNENRYSEALEIAEEMLKQYSNSTLFLWGKAKALFGLKSYTQSANTFRYILSKVESDPEDNHYTASLCHLWLAKIEYELGNFSQALAEANRVGYYDFQDDIKKRLEKFITESVEIRNQAQKKLPK